GTPSSTFAARALVTPGIPDRWVREPDKYTLSGRSQVVCFGHTVSWTTQEIPLRDRNILSRGLTQSGKIKIVGRRSLRSFEPRTRLTRTTQARGIRISGVLHYFRHP
ncbi:unnamed protein product, partial [Ectocarpus sp. 13 AM-2016]